MPDEKVEPSDGQEKPADEAATLIPVAPTAEELTIQLTAIRADKVRVEESYKALQRTLNKTNEDLKRQSDLRQELGDLREMQKLQAALIAESLNKSESELDTDVKARKPDLLQTYEIKAKEIEDRRKQVAQAAQQQTFMEQAKVLQDRVLALGLTENDEEYWEMRDMVESGKFQRAEMRLKKLESIKKPESKPEEDRINQLAQEKYEKMLQEKGLLKTDTASPSGRAGSSEDIIRRFAEGDPSVKESDYIAATGRG